jgi:hypothetical protein
MFGLDVMDAMHRKHMERSQEIGKLRADGRLAPLDRPRPFPGPLNKGGYKRCVAVECGRKPGSRRTVLAPVDPPNPLGG